MKECMWTIFFGVFITPSLGIRPVVHTEYGDILGTEWKSFLGRTFFAFMSIPYAEKPLGELRFEEPLEPQPWSVPIDGSVPPADCVQSSRPGYVTGQEDCLYLSVFTPRIEPGDQLPVVVFIPGGAFYFFSGNTFGPHYLLDQDLVLVSINYRLGIFGFLCTEDRTIPGNAGLKDQVLALGWVQRNIPKFGGDPRSVTLMGMSAGAVSAHLHYFSILSRGPAIPLAGLWMAITGAKRGLFHRGFLMGGTAFNTWAFQKRALEKAKAAARHVGCPTEDTKRMVACLKEAPAPPLAATSLVLRDMYGPISTWAPVVDKWSSNPYLEEFPIELLKKAVHYNVPVLFSDSSDAGLFPVGGFLDDWTLANLDLDWDDSAPSLLDLRDTVNLSLRKPITDVIRKFYFGNKHIYQNLTRFIELLSDRQYYVDLSRAVMLHASVNPRVRMYLFNYKGKQGISFHRMVVDYLGTKHDLGPGHVGDFMYLMNRTKVERSHMPEEDVKMIKRLTGMVYRYAKTGRAAYLPGERWPPQPARSSTGLTYLRVDGPDSYALVRNVADFGHGSFWQGLPLDEPWAGRSLLSCLPSLHTAGSTASFRCKDGGV